MSQIASFYLIKNNQRQELSNGDCEVIQFFREYLASNL